MNKTIKLECPVHSDVEEGRRKWVMVRACHRPAVGDLLTRTPSKWFRITDVFASAASLGLICSIERIDPPAPRVEAGTRVVWPDGSFTTLPLKVTLEGWLQLRYNSASICVRFNRYTQHWEEVPEDD